MAPNLMTDEAGLVLSWLEPDEGGHSLRFSRLVEGSWTRPATVVQGEGFFANWADFPSMMTGRDGALLAHWAEKSGSDTYAYDVRLAHSTDGGATWLDLGTAHRDGTPTEHGFVSMVPETAGIRIFWLDGREMLHDGGDGSMTL